jgi:hypothetical protein
MIRRQRPVDPLLELSAGTIHGADQAPLIRIVSDPGPETQPFLEPMRQPHRVRHVRRQRRYRRTTPAFSGPFNPVTRPGRKGWLR